MATKKTTNPFPYLTDASIKSNYATQLTDRLGALKTAAAAQKSPYETNIANAGQTYQPQRNDVYTSYMTGARTLRERMANMGLGAAGGASRLAENQNAIGLNKNLAGINLAQQNYVNEQNKAMQGISNQLATDTATAKSENTANLQQALMNQQNTNMGYYLQLFLNGNLKKKDFTRLTGIKI